MDVDSSGYLAYDLLFPNLERDRLRALVQATMTDPNVVAVHNPLYVVTNDPTQDPLITWAMSTPPSPGMVGSSTYPARTSTGSMPMPAWPTIVSS
jgi:non-lysosomal glucosylceramidase